MRNSGPWGQAFPEPIFDGEFYLIHQRIVGSKHLKVTLATQANSTQLIEGIAFNVDLDAWPNHRCERIRAAYRLDVNEFQGLRRVQIMLEYFEALT